MEVSYQPEIIDRLLRYRRMRGIASPHAGDAFGMLRFSGTLGLVKASPSAARRTHVLVAMCQCHCGRICFPRVTHLMGGKSKSCGCVRGAMISQRAKGLAMPRETANIRKHLGQIWRKMINRCTEPKCQAYKDYGGRGITVCDDWLNRERFIEWGVAHSYEVGLSIERVDNDGGYRPENCVWATPHQQSRNKRNSVKITAWGETKVISDWVNDPRCGAPNYHTIRLRLKSGLSPEVAIGTPAYTGEGSSRYYFKRNQ